MKTSKILIEQSKSNPCFLVWKIAKHNLSEGKITPNIFGLIRMNLERASINLPC